MVYRLAAATIGSSSAPIIFPDSPCAELNSIQFSGIGSGAILLATGELVPNTGALLATMKLGDFNQDISVKVPTWPSCSRL